MDQVDKNENVNLIINHQGGNGQPYRIAKLKRDYPAIAQRLELGEFKNVREAERAVWVVVEVTNITHNPITTIRHLPKIRMILESKMGNYKCYSLGKEGKEIDKTL